MIKKPKDAIAIKKGDIIQVDQVNPKLQMIRISDPEVGWEHLGFDELEAAPSAPEPVVTGTTKLSVRDDKTRETSPYHEALIEIKAILASLDPSVRDDVIENLVSVRDDTVDNKRLSELRDTPNPHSALRFVAQ